MAVVDETAKLIERVSYDAYGRARHHQPYDLNGDGAATQADEGLFLTYVNQSGVAADFNRDGVVNRNDRVMLQQGFRAAIPEGQLSRRWVDNPIGYGGYVFRAEAELYLARHRWYDTELGRWIERDPAGYVDGMNLYLYGLGSPYVFVDPLGLAASPCWWNPWTWGAANRDWEESARTNNELMKKHLERQAEEGKISEFESPRHVKTYIRGYIRLRRPNHVI